MHQRHGPAGLWLFTYLRPTRHPDSASLTLSLNILCKMTSSRLRFSFSSFLSHCVSLCVFLIMYLSSLTGGAIVSKLLCGNNICVSSCLDRNLTRCVCCSFLDDVQVVKAYSFLEYFGPNESTRLTRLTRLTHRTQDERTKREKTPKSATNNDDDVGHERERDLTCCVEFF